MNVDLESLETNTVHNGDLTEVIEMVHKLVQVRYQIET